MMITRYSAPDRDIWITSTTSDADLEAAEAYAHQHMLADTAADFDLGVRLMIAIREVRGKTCLTPPEK
jgi:hypothetical protein